MQGNGVLRFLYFESLYFSKMNGTDSDLAAHFTIIRKRGKCLYGLPIEQACGIYVEENLRR